MSRVLDKDGGMEFMEAEASEEILQEKKMMSRNRAPAVKILLGFRASLGGLFRVLEIPC